MKYLIAIIYSIAYQFVHIYFLFHYFEYLGYKSFPFTYWDIAVTTVFILLPLRLLPKSGGFTEVFFSSIYFLLYVPILITFLNHYKTFDDRFTNQVFFFVGFYVLFLIPKYIIFGRHRKVNINAYNFNTSYVLYITIFVLVSLMIAFRNQFSIVSFENVYAHRAENKLEGVMSYILLWNTYFFGPLTMIIGLLKSKKLYIVIGILAIITTYGITASKISLFIPLAIIGTHYILKKRKSIFKFYGVGLTALIAIFLAVPKQFFVLAAIVLMRTIGIGGLLTYQYNEYFKKAPLTYMSHSAVINAITGNYPYKEPLGFVVSKQYVTMEVNANANFWATDGIAGFGQWGVIFISIILGFTLALLRPIQSRANYRLLALIFVPFNVILLNVSFLTSIMSGGLLFLLMFVFYKRQVNKSIE
ncbi:MAG TPA: hypothetical protein VK668_17720 [Mucilaginibacter sp.]|nr:hypothetical protein [Mucilaginibacter sp.]